MLMEFSLGKNAACIRINNYLNKTEKNYNDIQIRGTSICRIE